MQRSTCRLRMTVCQAASPHPVRVYAFVASRGSPVTPGRLDRNLVHAWVHHGVCPPAEEHAASAPDSIYAEVSCRLAVLDCVARQLTPATARSARLRVIASAWHLP